MPYQTGAIFFQHKRRKRDPIAIFSFKNPDTFIVKLRRTHEKLDFLTIDRNKYQISIDQLDDCVQACLDKGLLIVPVTEQVENALSYGPTLPFDKEFKETDLYNKLFQYQKEGIEHVIRHFDCRALIADIGVPLAVCGRSGFLVIGTEIDWKEDVMGQRFEFTNPSASGSCGCGKTFSVDVAPMDATGVVTGIFIVIFVVLL